MDTQKIDLLEKSCDKLLELSMVYADIADLFLSENKKKLAEKYLDKSEEVMNDKLSLLSLIISDIGDKVNRKP